jgi:hypothetical protein
MDREQIAKIISTIDPDWIKNNLEGFTFEKAIELADYISKVINHEVEKPTSRSYLTSTCISRDLLISREVIRDILLVIGVGGQIASFSTTLADEINKDVPFKDGFK